MVTKTSTFNIIYIAQVKETVYCFYLQLAISAWGFKYHKVEQLI